MGRLHTYVWEARALIGFQLSTRTSRHNGSYAYSLTWACGSDRGEQEIIRALEGESKGEVPVSAGTSLIDLCLHRAPVPACTRRLPFIRSSASREIRV